jgi:hypothetical protein
MKKKILLIAFGLAMMLLITAFASIEMVNLRPAVIPIQETLLETIPLASAADFAILAGSSITNIGATSINGKIGLSPGFAVDGFPNGVLVWTRQINSYKSTQAKLDLTTAYEDAEGRKSKEMVKLNGNIGGLILTPGLYKSTSSLQISSGDLTFDAMGKSNAIFIIQIESNLTTRPETKVILKGGALASNIFWQVGNTVTLGTNSGFKGTILALKSITFCNGATLDGRGFSRGGEVILADNKIDSAE